MTAPSGAPNWFAAWPASLPGDLVAAWRASAPPGLLRWFCPADHHVTLAFFGPLEAGQRDAVARRLGACVHAPVDATLGRLVPLPRPERFSALSFELAGGRAEVEALMREHRDGLRACAGLPPENRPPLPHLTIARPSGRLSRLERDAVLRWAATLAPPALTVPLGAPVLYTRAAGPGSGQFQVWRQEDFGKDRATIGWF